MTMLEEPSIVVKADYPHIWVHRTQQSACGGCQQQTRCSTHALNSLFKPKPIRVDSELPLAIGDQVIVSIDESSVLRAAFIIYLLPLLAIFCGAGIADSLIGTNANADIWIAASGIGSFLLCLLLINMTQTMSCFQHLSHPFVSSKISTHDKHLGD